MTPHALQHQLQSEERVQTWAKLTSCGSAGVVPAEEELTSPVSAQPAALAAHPAGMTAPVPQYSHSTPATGCSPDHQPGVSVCDAKQGLWGPLCCAIPPPCRDMHLNMVGGCVLLQGR